MSTVRLRRLQADFDKVREYINRHPRLQLIQTEGTPPERYQLEYRIRGMRQTADELSMVKSHMVEISLPLNYPRMPPQCRMLTPIFHPNIAPHAICIGDHWSPGEPLWSIIARIGEMIAYQSYNTKSPLNGEAARWVDQHLDELPLDPVSMMPDDVGAAEAGVGLAAEAHGTPRLVESPLDTLILAAPPPLAVAPPVPVPPPPSPVPAGTASVAAESERRLACPQCGSLARWKPELAGKQMRCPRCRTVFRAPSA
jgi:ubiquitin-protein ligase